VLPFANTITVQATTTNFVEVIHSTEGEYQKDVVLRYFIDGKTIRLEEQLSPSFTPFHDKLSAHKVMASTFEIHYPEQLVFGIKAGTAKMMLKGIFTKLNIQLEDGLIELKSPFSSGRIRTNTAHINVTGLQNGVSAKTTKGEISGQNSPKEQAALLLESKRGNIFINSNRK